MPREDSKNENLNEKLRSHIIVLKKNRKGNKEKVRNDIYNKRNSEWQVESHTADDIEKNKTWC